MANTRRSRRVFVNLVTVGLSLLIVAALYFLLPLIYPVLATHPGAARQGHNPLFRVSIGTGYVSVLLLVFSLLIGPWHLIRKHRRVPVHLDLRRDVSIWAGVYALIHVGFGLFIHVRRDHLSNLIYNFIYPPHVEHISPIRLGFFGIANHLGLIATLLVLVLLAISNDYSVRTLGSTRWKAWQRWTYYFSGLVVIHSILYEQVEHRPVAFIVAFALVVLIGLVAQIVGMVFYRRHFRPAR